MNKDLKELAENVKSSFELFDCKFVAPFPKEVQTDCSVCLHTLKQPYIVGCCGYRFCKSCLAPSVISCPLWKEVNFDKLQDKQLERLLIQRPVYCLLQDSGCKWTGELGKLSSHLSFEDSLSVTACEKLPVPIVEVTSSVLTYQVIKVCANQDLLSASTVSTSVPSKS